MNTAAGHEVASHGWRWIDYRGVPEEVERAEIARCVATIEKATGTRPKGWQGQDYGESPRTPQPNQKQSE